MFNGFYRALYAIGYTHPIHPTLVNMPIGLVVGALVLALAAVVCKNSPLAVSARHVVIVALIFLIVTAAAGVVDWMHFYSGVWLFQIKVKVWLAGFLFVLLVSAVVFGARLKPASPILIGIYALSFFTVAALGFFGADLVFGGRTPPLPEQFRAGETVYRMNCSGCHPYGGNSVSPRKAVLGSDKLKDLETFVDWIRSPQPPMPTFAPDRISDVEAQQLYQYAKNLHD
ncbi:MAG: cytochrome c [Syntrophobacteraceae bacterium]|nr:cytochrome c [Syntrophobacteraceae bacterium]